MQSDILAAVETFSDSGRIAYGRLVQWAARLDGGASNPKKDVNGEGRVLGAAEEDVFPRADFNGNGHLDDDASFVTGLVQADMTDLALLQLMFDDPWYEATALPDLSATAVFPFDVAAGDSVTIAVFADGNYGWFSDNHAHVDVTVETGAGCAAFDSPVVP